MGFWVGTFLKTQRNAQKFVEKAAYLMVAPPSEWIRTISGKKFDPKIAREKRTEMLLIAEEAVNKIMAPPSEFICTIFGAKK